MRRNRECHHLKNRDDLQKSKRYNRFSRDAATEQALIGLQFPADKNKIVRHVQQQSQTNLDRDMMPVLEKVEDKQIQTLLMSPKQQD